jgi:hypothetical protein
MRTIETSIGPSQTPQPLLSAGARLATAIGVAALVSIAWVGAEDASRDAVQATTAVLSPNVIRVTLPTVQIVAHREPATVASVAASNSLRAAPQALWTPGAGGNNLRP